MCVSSSGCSVLVVLFCSLACFLCVSCIGSLCSCSSPVSVCLYSWVLGCVSCMRLCLVSVVCRMSVLWCPFYLCVCCVWCLYLWLVRVCYVLAVLLWLCLVVLFRCFVVFCLLPVVCCLLRVVVVVVSLRSCVYCWLIGWLFCCVLESLLWVVCWLVCVLFCGVAQVVFAFWVCVFGVCFGVAGWGGAFWVLAYRSF